MADTAELLRLSRESHRLGKAALSKRDPVTARAHFHVALQQRLEARKGDPDRLDAAWRDDALHPQMRGERERRFLRSPGMTTDQIALQQDANLERFYREQLGEISNVLPAPENPEVLTPKQWVEVQPGKRDPETGRLVCQQRHVFKLETVDQRTCQGCGQVEELRETKAIEETMAHQQMRRERA